MFKPVCMMVMTICCLLDITCMVKKNDYYSLYPSSIFVNDIILVNPYIYILLCNFLYFFFLIFNILLCNLLYFSFFSKILDNNVLLSTIITSNFNYINMNTT